MKISDNLGKGTTIQPVEINITDKDIYMHPKLQKDLDGIIANIQRPAVFGSEMGYSGILFTGPPGTGKTLYAQWMAYKTGVKFFDIGLVTGPDYVRKAYEQVRATRDELNQPVILFMDEVDRFSSREDIVDPSQSATLNQLLMEMDGTASNIGIYTIAASNKPEKIDNALRRPGRFGKETYFLPPDERGRLEILRIHAYNKDHKFEVEERDLEELSKITYGYTGADVKGVLIEAFVHANLNNRTKVEYGDLGYAFKKIKPSAIRDMPFKEPSIELDDLCGYEMQKEVLTRIMDYRREGLILFYGPDGNGKTSFAEATAGKYGYNLIVVSASDPEDKFVGETGKKISKYIERAKQLAPSILLFDKIDALVEKKGVMSWRGSWTGLLESKLSQPTEGVTVMATVCDPTVLNETFLGMFPHKILVDKPTNEDQIKIWGKYLGDAEIDSEKLVAQNGKLSCRDISQICQRVIDFGLPQTQEVYTHILSAYETLDGGLDYADIRKKIGDSVSEYESVKDLIEEKKNDART